MLKTGSILVHRPRFADVTGRLTILADVKPDNILVNWTSDSGGRKTASGVALGDFDIAFKSGGGKARETPYAIGNAMWRSPEGQTGRGVTKSSDIFSFGLVVSAFHLKSAV